MSIFGASYRDTSRTGKFAPKSPVANNFYSVDQVVTNPQTLTTITLQEAKDHLIVTSADDDTILTSMLAACISAIERYCGVSILQQTISLQADIWYEFELPYGPVAAFTSAAIKTAINTYTTLVANTDYEIDNTLQFPRYIPFQTGRIKMVYTTGYADKIPGDLKLAVLNELAFRYENRGDSSSAQRNSAQGTSTAIETGICHPAQQLANAYKRLTSL